MNSLGVDVSRYNGPVNWQVGKANGVKYAGYRASISWGYRDPFAAYNRDGLRAQGIYRMPYHVLYPGEPIAAQVNNFYQAAAEDWTQAVPVLDLELHHNFDKFVITRAIVQWCEQVEAATKRKPIIYSRASWVNEHTTLGDWRNRWDWWLAQYLFDRTIERPAPPTRPTGVTDWLIHQNCDKKTAFPGFAAEGFIATCDIDRWNGDDAVVDAYFLGGIAPPQPVDVKAIGRATVTASALNVRTGPGTDADVSGNLLNGAQVYGYKKSGDWVAIGPNVWICTGPGLADWVAL